MAFVENTVMDVSNPTVDEIVQHVKALPSGGLARLDAELSELRRRRMRALTAAARSRTQGVCERDTSEAVDYAVQATRGSQPA